MNERFFFRLLAMFVSVFFCCKYVCHLPYEGPFFSYTCAFLCYLACFCFVFRLHNHSLFFCLHFACFSSAAMFSFACRCDFFRMQVRVFAYAGTFSFSSACAFFLSACVFCFRLHERFFSDAGAFFFSYAGAFFFSKLFFLFSRMQVGFFFVCMCVFFVSACAFLFCLHVRILCVYRCVLFSDTWRCVLVYKGVFDMHERSFFIYT